jgi:hypothetical protein
MVASTTPTQQVVGLDAAFATIPAALAASYKRSLVMVSCRWDGVRHGSTGGSMDKIRVGMIGAGWIAQEHRRVLDSLADAELGGLRRRRERAETLAKSAGARAYLDWRDVTPLGALIVAHFIAPKRRSPRSEGLPLYLKPIARTAEAAGIVAAAERTSTVCAIGYQWHALDLLD